jgi:hypothetical protein
MSTNDFVNNSSETGSKTSSKFSNFKKPNFNFSKSSEKLKSVKKTHFYIGGILIALVLVFLAGRYFAPSTTLGEISGGDTRTAAPTPIATQELNKSFDFPLLDDKAKEVAKIKYIVESANLQDAFIYQGKTATAVKGRTFLIFNLKITNPYSKTIEINAKDYIRIKMNGSEEQLAPEIHNDPVQIQADSTKYTRIGLPINDTDKDIILLIGELDGKKETIKLNLEK